MKVTEVRLSRKFNLGNYESMEIAATAEPDSEETKDQVFQKLDAFLLSKRPLQGKNGFQGGRQ